MELVKRNIHMDRMKSKASTQITLEDDINISDSKPDAFSLILDRGNIVIEEVKVTNDHAALKGKLAFTVLYLTEGEDADIACMEGSIPFEEQVNMEGVQNGDHVQVKCDLEDMSVGLINSRKLSVQAIMNLRLVCEVINDEEIAVDLRCDEPMEYRRKSMEIAAMAIKKKDIFRVKEEMELPGSYPNILSVIWESVAPGEVEFKILDDKISVQGEVKVFLLYRAENEDNSIYHYETTVPFSGVIECQGCSEGMIPEITWALGQKEIEIRPDFDGEDRVITLEMVLDLDICVYEEENLDILSDIYGVIKEVEVEEKEAVFRKLLTRSNGKSKLAEHLVIREDDPSIKKVLNSTGQMQISNQEIMENAIGIQGVLLMQILYETNDEKRPYGIAKGMFPFQYELEADDITPDCLYKLQSDMEQLNVTALDSNELDVKAVLCFRCNVYKQLKEKAVERVNISEPDMEKLNSLPGIAVYIVKDGESLWDIGKRYYVPISQIKETNDMVTDEVKAGDKILIVKGMK